VVLDRRGPRSRLQLNTDSTGTVAIMAQLPRSASRESTQVDAPSHVHDFEEVLTIVEAVSTSLALGSEE
jgi:hypothetical protein